MKYLSLTCAIIAIVLAGCQPQVDGEVTPEDVAALVVQGNNQLQSNAHQEAIKTFENAKALSTQLGNETHLPAIYQRLGYLYLITQQYAEASTHLKDALNIGLDNKDQYSKVFFYLGMVGQQFQDFASAAAYYDKSLSLFLELDDLNMVSQAQLKLGQCFRDLKMYDQAMNSLRLAEATTAEHGFEKLHNDIMVSIGVLHFKMQEYNKAIVHYNTALQQTNHGPTEAALHHDLALVYVKYGDAGLAIIHFDKAITTYTQLGLRNRCFDSYSGKASLLNMQGDEAGAQECLERAIDVAAQGIYFTDVVNKVHQRLIELYSNQNRFKEAVAVSKQLHQLKDERLYANADMQYELDQLKLALADQAIAHNDEVKQMQAEAQDGLVYTSFLIAALLGAIIMSWQSKRKAQLAEAKLANQE